MTRTPRITLPITYKMLHLWKFTYLKFHYEIVYIVVQYENIFQFYVRFSDNRHDVSKYMLKYIRIHV
jgi:hypothetical protein